eukprot:NODE_1725_length_901_cov_318.781690_g1201_i0.p1 GENE.NODE_1725_length_901_cov_318.781690_g1201_i0~~NODE_1725_length_901_cov_318.781690_g1201_i0.p1  ORF type:complete len:183 (+),score=48.73 NODE_1725_length_901_cov_318.781690_g1201_i0:301-849(+)
MYMPGHNGYEAAVYLRFILECWDSLPESTAFLHAHRSSWHSSDIVTLLRHLRWDRRAPYVSLNLHMGQMTQKAADQAMVFYGRLTQNEVGGLFLTRVWRQLFQQELGPYQPIARHICAQHVVTREAIRSRSRAFYMRLYMFLMRGIMGSYHSARLLENTWNWIFGGQANARRLVPCEALRCE